eukprot:TRINITY_DN23124_c2_g2_i1.p1 TRINITY_DN23124_c2_g2~~TRINITY_DN23124_c2_g2_i1.p1  ORF type:complete len:377 (+),score=123.84 TRINITY_DN23124_c2_g2_i1:130-1131(+)
MAMGLLGAMQAQSEQQEKERLEAKSVEPKLAQQDIADRDIRRLGAFFNIEDEWVKRLDEVMEKRPDSKERDLAKLYEILDTARNPSNLLVAKLEELEDDAFVANFKRDERIDELVKQFSLDEPAHCRLVELRVRRPKKQEEDHKRLRDHLSACKDPSFTAFSLIKKLVQGRISAFPDLSQASALMQEFQLSPDARIKLRDIVEKRSADLVEVMAHLRQILQLQGNSSSHLLKVADTIIAGGTASEQDMEDMARQGMLQEHAEKKAQKAAEKAAKKAKKKKKESDSDSSESSDEDSSDSSESEKKKKKKGKKAKKKKDKKKDKDKKKVKKKDKK